MPLTVSISASGPGSVIGNRTNYFVATVSNPGAVALSLNSLQIFESTESDAQISQPVIFAPNTPVGTSNPVIPAGSSSSYMFSVIFTNPTMSGPSPQNAPGGAAPANAAYYADAFFTLAAVATASDGTVGTASQLVGVITAGSPPPSQGGTLQFSSGFNLINGLITGAL